MISLRASCITSLLALISSCGGVAYVGDESSCVGPHCAQLCAVDRDCPSGAVCTLGRCSTRDGGDGGVIVDEDGGGGDPGDGGGDSSLGDGSGGDGDEGLGDSPVGDDNPFAGDGDGGGGDQDGDAGGGDAGGCTPGAPEQCNGLDDNCNDVVDEGVRNACGNCEVYPLCNDRSGGTGNQGGVLDQSGGDLTNPFADAFDAVSGDGVQFTPNPDNSGRGSVSLSGGTQATDFAWPASESHGTVSRVDTLTNLEVARYATVLSLPNDPRRPYVALYDHTPDFNPRTACQEPSRSTVDELGNAYIANRAVSGYSGKCDNENAAPNQMSSVTKIAYYNDTLCNSALNPGLVGCQCVDRNGDGFIQTSRDYDGDANSDGRLIEMSTCPGDCSSVTVGACVGAGCSTPCVRDAECGLGSVCVFDPTADASGVGHKQRCSTSANLPEFLGVSDECLAWTRRIPGTDTDAQPFSDASCTGATCANATTYCNEGARTGTQCADNLCDGSLECNGAPASRTTCSSLGCSYCNEGARSGTQCADGLCDGDEECQGAPNGAAFCAPSGCSTTMYQHPTCLGANCPNSYCNESARSGTQCGDNLCDGNQECQGEPNGNTVCSARGCSYCNESARTNTQCGDGICDGGQECNGAASGLYCAPGGLGCSRLQVNHAGNLRAAARGMALDKDGYIWVGAHARSTEFKLDGNGNFVYPADPDGTGPLTARSICPTTLRYVATGAAVPSGSEGDCVSQRCYETLPASCRLNVGTGAYGAVVDSGRSHPNRFGYVWLTNGASLVRVDTENGDVVAAPTRPATVRSYGITIDHEDRAWAPDSFDGDDDIPVLSRHNPDVCVGARCATSCNTDAQCNGGAGERCFYGKCSTQLGTWTIISPSLCIGPWCDYCDSNGDGTADTSGACADRACDDDTQCGTAGAGHRACSRDAITGNKGCTRTCSTNSDCRPYWGAECDNGHCSWDRHNGGNVSGWRGRGATTELIGDEALCAAQGAAGAPCSRVWAFFHNSDWNAGANNPPNMLFVFDADSGRELTQLRRRLDRDDDSGSSDPSVNGIDNLCSGPVGLGLGIGGRVWSVNYQDDSMCAYDPADPLADIDSVLIDLNPYTYSDFTGNLFRSFTNPQGKYKVLIEACPPPYILRGWTRIDWAADVPLQSTLEVRWRFGFTAGAAANPTAPQLGPVIEDANNGTSTAPLDSTLESNRWIEVEFNLKAGDDGSKPTLTDFEVVRECMLPE